ncbi:MAG TPA: HAMP domain-containing sensor histidine kinase [Acidobacteriaceae bacterium]|nr:HAMP domain-containing sensor histidine kinase [Acidobacteriaceae bacterium]
MTAAFQQQEPNRSDPATLSASTPEEQRATAVNHLAHDARNWLTVLQVYCDLLRSSGTVAGHGRTWIEELSNAVERGQGLVTSLLDSAQIASMRESSTVETAAAGPNTLDLAAVIQTQEPLFRQMAGNTIRVETKTAVNAQTNALQELEFDRILLNLVRNGIDAMPQGGQLTIELEHGAPCERRPLVLRVSDTGNGIPADILPHIFESGFSTKSTACHAKSGRGYGLAIVRSLTLAAGGSVQVRSRIGHGTCFTIELPVQITRATPRSAASQPGNIALASKRATQTPGRTRQTNNFGAHRKGTRVPC